MARSSLPSFDGVVRRRTTRPKSYPRFTGHPFLDALAKLCRKYRWSSIDLARQIGLDASVVQKVFRGDYAFSSSLILGVVNAVDKDDAFELLVALYLTAKSEYGNKAAGRSKTRSANSRISI